MWNSFSQKFENFIKFCSSVKSMNLCQVGRLFIDRYINIKRFSIRCESGERVKYYYRMPNIFANVLEIRSEAN